ncbi:MAG: cytochrome P450 [Actinobacteria bacterium]|nr:cytochrome P450 [Actinomycetota bacterium]
MSKTDEPTGVALFDFTSEEIWSNPYPYYRELRETRPICPSEVDAGTWMLFRYQDCVDVLRDPRWSSNPAHHPVEPGTAVDMRTALADGPTNILLFLDPPDHTRLRKLVSKAFTPRTVEGLRGHIQDLVDGIVGEAREKGGLDIVADLGYTVPVTVICELMGVPLVDREMFGPWSSDASRLLDGLLEPDVMMAGMMGAMNIINYFNDLYQERRESPGDDLLSALVQAEEAGDRLSEEELRAMTILLFVAGHETTMNLIGNGMKALLENPDQMRLLVDDPSLAPSAVEELLRFDGPVHLTGRTATEDLEIGGHQFGKGDQVIVYLSAANRDPLRFDRPDDLDVARPDNQHLTFSHGIHYCLGAALARVEGQVAISTLVQRFPDMQLVTEQPTYRDHFVLRGLRELRVAV